MNKIILVLSFIGIALLFSFGLFSPASPIVWLASTSNNFAILRIFLLLVLAGLILTEPPRNKVFRILVGFVSISLMAWAFGATYQNEMKFMDSLVLLEVGVAAAVAVLERKTTPEPAYELKQKTTKKRLVKHSQLAASH